MAAGPVNEDLAERSEIEAIRKANKLPDARTWVLNNQLARRNLHPNGASYLRGKRYLAEKQRQGEYQKCQSDTFVGDTDERLAAALGVSTPTINRDAAFALAVDALAGETRY